MLVAIALATALATFVGGALALHFKDKLHLILGFSAGAVVGVAFFDLIPEALELSYGVYDTHTILLSVAVGFFIYLFLDRSIVSLLGLGAHEDHAGHVHVHPERGVLGASTLSFHSFLDGVVIGISFQVSAVVGGVVTLAVLAHDFSDGINTVNMIIKNNGSRPLMWLIVDALAPVVGILLTLVVVPPPEILSLLLAVFGGFFLYIGASDLVPESHHAHPKLLTSALTLVGALSIYALISLV